MMLVAAVLANWFVSTHAQERDLLRVSLINLIATPEKYDRRTVWVSGYARIRLEDMSLCLVKEPPSGHECIWIEIFGAINTEEDSKRYLALLKVWEQFHGKLISMSGTFDKENTGHLGGWSGGIKQITRVYGPDSYVDFTSNPPLQRTREGPRR